ncbi:MAG: leucine-rich repeat domain-containing protein, partial [Gammaproteobacteria bacterium]|nr:leucine-rich repeat domain-containing protein [Gammaproteobacteria bacterium]
MKKGVSMNFRSRLSILIALTSLCFPFIATHAQPTLSRTLSPEDHCRNFSRDAIVTFADSDLAEVVHNALGLDAQAPLSCGQAAELERLAVTATSERVVYGGTLRPARAPSEPAFESLDGIQNLTGLTTLTMFNRLITDIGPLRHLTNLTDLVLHTNWISDIEPL